MGFDLVNTKFLSSGCSLRMVGWVVPCSILLRLWLVPDSSLCVQPVDATANRGLAPNASRVWLVSPNAFHSGWTASALGQIPNHMSTSRCVMMTLHLGRDDRGKENVVFPPFRTVSRFKLEIGTLLRVWSA